MKKYVYLFLTAALTFSLAGCGGSKQEPSGADAQQSAAQNPSPSSDSDSETPTAPVTLCDYKNLTGEKPVYTVSEEDIDTKVEDILYDYIDTAPKAAPAAEGDTVVVHFTADNGEDTIMDYTEETYEIVLGYEEFGPELDAKLTGASAGDAFELTVSYDADYDDEDFAGKAITFKGSVDSVMEEVQPTLSEEFIKNELGYSSEQNMRDELKKSLEKENETESNSALRENLIQQVVEQSTFGEYPQELYDSCAAEIAQMYSFYAEMFGCSTTAEIYELFGITEEDVQQEILDQVHRILAVRAIAEENGITVSDDDYNSYVNSLLTDLEYESKEDLLEEYPEDTIKYWRLEEKVLNYLAENATVKEVAPDTFQYDGEE